MAYFVYRAVKGKPYPDNWELIAECIDLAAAEAIAIKEVPKTSPLYTEPGHGLELAFFGSAHSQNWKAMIDTGKHKERKARDGSAI